MKITLSFEKTISDDLSIVVDVLRASTTITAALNNFDEVIPCFSPEEAFKIYENINGVLAGERNGAKIEGFHVGNSPETIENYDIGDKTPKLILTTTNGTRIIENINSTILIGSLINAKAVAKAALNISKNHINVVMAGRKGHFAIEDFLAAGEILHWIINQISPDENYELSEYALSAILARENYSELKKAFYNSYSGKKLCDLGYQNDVDYCIQKNISENVAIYEKGLLKLL